jgi:hypothetical protein
MLAAHQFDLDLASGRLSGELFLDVHPGTFEFGMLSRLTALDLAEALPERFLARMPAGEKRLSGRSGFVVDLNRSSIDGRVNLTEVGGPQLTALVNLLDPAYEDEKMNKVRTLLTYGYPTAVGLAFADGSRACLPNTWRRS